jgi:hypothetical protein
MPAHAGKKRGDAWRGCAMLRVVVLALGVLQTIALALFAAILLGSSDPWGIGRAVVALVAVPYVLLTLPGMTLAFIGRWLPLALLLVVVAAPIAFALWSYA